MFAKQEFIDASRKFVCVRIETYENKAAEAKVRSLLNGTYANTAFCVFDPQGERHLSRTGRSPKQGLASRRGRGGNSDEEVIDSMNRIASRYRSIGKNDDITLQDFLTFRQALNVSSADQRLLLFANIDQASKPDVESTLKNVFSDPDIVGKFHLNFVDSKVDQNWNDKIKGTNDQAGLVIIHAGQFGIDGSVVKQLPVDANAQQVKTVLLAANEQFIKTEARKRYADHVRQGRRQRVYFENEIPYGEDRDGDGKIDTKGGRGRK